MGINFEVVMTIIQNLGTLEFLISFIVAIVGGIVIGALPGFSSTMGIALLIPITFGMDPVPALTMLAVIYAASTYGGSFSAILIRTPGTSASVATALEGYPMTLNGEGLKALGLSAVASVIGGVVGGLALMFLAPPLAQISLKFSAPEYFLLGIFGLSIIAGLSSGSIIKGMFSGAFGLFLGTIGVDAMSGLSRFTFGMTTLEGGVTMIPPMIGLFSLAEMLVQMEKIGMKEQHVIPVLKGKFLPTWSEFKSVFPTISISSIIGLFIGILPAAGSDIASWVAYGRAKGTSKTPELFTKGSPHGLVASEAANNAACGGALIPLLTLGIPGSAAAAVFMGGLLIQGLHTGHELFTKNISTTYAIIVGYILANIIMGFVGWLSAKHIVKVSTLKKEILIPIVAVLSVVGTYAVTTNMFEVYFMIFFAFIGYFMFKANYSSAAIILGLILGPIIETGYMQSLVMSKGNMLTYYLSRPICVILLVIMAIVFSIPGFMALRNRKRKTA